MIKNSKPLTAIETVRHELSKVLLEQMQCIDDFGIVHPQSRNRYNELTKEAKKYKESLDLLESYAQQSKT